MASVVVALHLMDPYGHGLTTVDIIRRLKDAYNQPEWMVEFRAAVEELCPRLDVKSLGYKFRHFKHRIFGGWRLVSVGGRNGNKWKVQPASAKKPDGSRVPLPSDSVATERGDPSRASDRSVGNSLPAPTPCVITSVTTPTEVAPTGDLPA